MRNSLIAHNSASSGGGCISAQLVGCTVVANSGGGVSSSTVSNCIVWGNTGTQVQGGTVEYSDVQGGAGGAGNINQDPLFLDPNAGDYRLQPVSPCVDRGNPGYQPLAGECDLAECKRVWDGDRLGAAVVDMGAYEYGSFGYGDLNCDGHVDFSDINPFVLALSDPAGYGQAFPTCSISLGDVNGDGLVDFSDINPFVALLTG